MIPINRVDFFLNLTTNGLKATKFDGYDAILNEWEDMKLTDLRWLAYIFATVYHETDKTMMPIEEHGKGAGKKYGKRIKFNGKPYTGEHLYYGRGHTQNTWYEIYEMLTSRAKAAGKNWDFINHPELLLTMEPSIWATFLAMTKGLYTGVGLSRYFNADKEDWVNARKIINGLDKAEHIAELAKEFYLCLTVAPKEKPTTANNPTA